MNDWEKGEPKKEGYYLVAWRYRYSRRKIIVSELWYNPDAVYHWWFSRGYIYHVPSDLVANNALNPLVQEIIAWMPMPDPPKE